MRHFYLLLLLLYSTGLQAFYENDTAGARAQSMGNASVALSDIWAAYHNQAILAKLNKISVGIYYENRFTTKELSTKAFHFNYPSKFGTFALVYSQFGFSLYKESKAGIAYSRALGKHFWLGLQFDYLTKNLTSEYGKQSKYTFELGLLAELFPNFLIGFHVFNPNQSHFEMLDYTDEIPSIAKFGFSWKLSERTIICSEIRKNFDENIRTKIGMEYQINKQFALRAGMNTQPNTISLGIGYSFKILQANISYSRHSVLGYTPTIDLTITF